MGIARDADQIAKDMDFAVTFAKVLVKLKKLADSGEGYVAVDAAEDHADR